MRLRLRSRFGRLRRRDRVLGAAGGSAIAASIALAVVSLILSWQITATTRSVWVAGGAVYVGWSPNAKFLPTAVSEPQREWVWIPYYHEEVTIGILVYRWVSLPLWMFFMLGLALATPAMLHMRGMRFDHICPACGYDITGIGGVCPECGQGPTRPSPSP
ncbi:MAG: hypothetical protein IT431_00960 [Phycisphaerales bacterium]|nr:hypothetical protein [Phycisphaerales bacterium]